MLEMLFPPNFQSVQVADNNQLKFSGDWQAMTDSVSQRTDNILHRGSLWDQHNQQMPAGHGWGLKL